MALIPSLIYGFFSHTNHPDTSEKRVQEGIVGVPALSTNEARDHEILHTSLSLPQLPNVTPQPASSQPNLQDLPPENSYRLLPVFAGIMIPFSILLSIPSLTGQWYIQTQDNVIVATRDNPLVLVLATGLSLASAVLANACLVARLARDHYAKPATVCCIVFLTIHDLISIPLVTVFGIKHRFDDGFTYGQPFWMTVCATAVSTTTNAVLIVDYRRTSRFSQKGSGITPKQRSLLVIVIVLLVYIAFGSLIFTFLQKINFIDALYFSVVSIETIGFGDIPPRSTASRVFTCIFVAGGILNIGLLVAVARNALLEAAAVDFQSRLASLRRRLREQQIRKRWRAALKWHLRANRHPVWVSTANCPDLPSPQPESHWWLRLLRQPRVHLRQLRWRNQAEPSIAYLRGRRPHRRLNVAALTDAQLDAAAMEAGAPLSVLLPHPLRLRLNNESNIPLQQQPNSWVGATSDSATRSPRSRQPLTHVRLGVMSSLLGKFAIGVAHGRNHIWRQDASVSGVEDVELNRSTTSEHGDDDNNDDEEDDDDDDATVTPSRGHGVPFSRSITLQVEDALPEKMENEERIVLYARLCVAWGLFFVFWISGSLIFMRTEDWTFGSALYFCFITFTTVGYGDLAPRTPAGRSIFVVWALLGVGTMTMLISILTEAYSDRYRHLIKDQLQNLEDTNVPLDVPSSKLGDSRYPTSSASDARTAVAVPTNEKINTTASFPADSGTSSTQVRFLLPTPQPGLVQRSSPPRMGPAPELCLEDKVLQHAQTLRSLMKIPLGESSQGQVKVETVELLFRDIERSLQTLLSDCHAQADSVVLESR